MKILKIEGNVLQKVIDALGKSRIFQPLNEKALSQIATRAILIQYSDREIIVKTDEPSDSFFLIIKGVVAILHTHQPTVEMVEIGRIQPFNVIGEIGLMLEHPRTATVQSIEETWMLKFDSSLFNYMFEHIPAFGPAICRNLAQRVHELSSNIALPQYQRGPDLPSSEVLRLLPMDLLIRHRVLPLQIHDNSLLIGFVHDPTPGVLHAIRRLLPGMELKMVNIDNDFFDAVLKSQAGVEGWYPEKGEVTQAEEPVAMERQSPRLDALLKRLIAEGASDLHLTACQIPYWRIDGELKPISDAKELGTEEVFDLLNPIMDEKSKNEFISTHDSDFAYSIPGVARFRVNIYRDNNGISSSFRVIPTKIVSLEQLGMPPIIKKLCDQSKGLVLVTGPTGSGKSTTLAAMVDYINNTRQCHILTMEDPIEFVHKSQKALINQRQIGNHTHSFESALRAALREDPDVVLIGELRDLETITLALEVANTGHLVMGTLHTNSAVSTITRIIDVFPPEQQSQIRTGLCDTLRGVISQNLCKCIGGGRVAALEVLMVNLPIANLIREQKLNQIQSSMQTGKSHGHRIMDEELATLVRRRKIKLEDALSKTTDREALMRIIEDASIQPIR